MIAINGSFALPPFIFVMLSDHKLLQKLHYQGLQYILQIAAVIVLKVLQYTVKKALQCRYNHAII